VGRSLSFPSPPEYEEKGKGGGKVEGHVELDSGPNFWLRTLEKGGKI